MKRVRLKLLKKIKKIQYCQSQPDVVDKLLMNYSWCLLKNAGSWESLSLLWLERLPYLKNK